MNKHLLNGLIASILSALPIAEVVDKCVELIDKIVNGDETIGDSDIVFGVATVMDLASEPEFWDNAFVVNNIVAAYLEAVTMKIANPILAVAEGASQEDVRAIVQASDSLQIEAVPLVMERCNDLFRPKQPQIRRVADTMGNGLWERTFVF